MDAVPVPDSAYIVSGLSESVAPVTAVCTAPVPDADTSHHVCGDRGASAAVYAVPVAMVEYAAQMLAVFVTPPAASVIRERRCEGAGQNEPRAGASGAFQNTLLRSILLCVV